MKNLKQIIAIILSNLEKKYKFNELKTLSFNCGIECSEISNLYQSTFNTNKKLISKTDLISAILNCFDKKDKQIQQIITNCFLEKIINSNKFDLNILKKDLLRFGYQIVLLENRSEIVVLKELFDIDNINNYPIEIKDSFMKAINAIQNGDYKSAIIKLIYCIENITNKYFDNPSKINLEEKIRALFENNKKQFEKLKTTEKDTNNEKNIEKLFSSIGLFL